MILNKEQARAVYDAMCTHNSGKRFRALVGFVWVRVVSAERIEVHNTASGLVEAHADKAAFAIAYSVARHAA